MKPILSHNTDHPMEESTDSQPSFDIARSDTWFGLKPGMSKEEVLSILRNSNAEIDEAEENPTWLMVTADGWGLEIYFTEGADPRVRQLNLDDSDCRWNGRPFLCRPMHETLDALGHEAAGAAWRPEDAADEPFLDLTPLGTRTASDTELLREGTVWLPRQNRGLVLCEGEVIQMVWRQPHDLPREFLGPVTEVQRQITARKDCADFLRDAWTKEEEVATPSKPWNPIQRSLTVWLVIGLGYIGWKGFQETQRWHRAVTLPGQVVAIEPAADSKESPTYRVKYTNPSGDEQTVALERYELYVPPQKVGDEVPIMYSPEEPATAHGLAYARDIAFFKYTPWVLGAGFVYIIGMFLAGPLGRRRKAEPAQPIIPGLRGGF